MRIGEPRMVTYQTVYYEEPNRSGTMQRKVSDYVEPSDLDRFRARIEKRGGRIIRVHEPRQVESIPVGF